MKGGYQPQKFWDTWSRDFIKDPWQAKTHTQHQWLLEKIKRSKPQTILEVGCGFGRNINFLINNNIDPKRITGVDISPKMIHEAEKYLNKRSLRLITAHAEQLPFKDKSFDVVFTHGVFMHISPQKINRAFQEIVRVTRKYVIIIEQNYITSDVSNYTFVHDYKKLCNDSKLILIEYNRDNKLGLDLIYGKVR